MKPVFLFFLFSICTFFSFGQYRAIYDSLGTSWSFRFEVPDASLVAEGALYLGVDTVFNGIAYKQVILTNFSGTNQRLVGFFRENDSHSKAWYWALNEGGERLIMDLDLVVGDSFQVAYQAFNKSNFLTRAVVAVDSVQGFKRIRFTPSQADVPLDLIEGVGPSIPLIAFSASEEDFDHYFSYSPDFFVCQFFHGDTLLYVANESLQTCETFVGIDGVEEVSMKIFPNPFVESFTIQSGRPLQTGIIHLSDPMGRDIGFTEVRKGEQTIVFPERKSPGWLYVRIQSDQGVFTQKLQRIE
ncbi:MAG: T9SS type A sorting domain-containing protein [Bacteroidota bacterium]